jgi:hypothetical protein
MVSLLFPFSHNADLFNYYYEKYRVPKWKRKGHFTFICFAYTNEELILELASLSSHQAPQ